MPSLRPVPALAAAVILTACAHAEPAGVAYSPPAPGTTYHYTDSPDGTKPSYSMTAIASGPDYTIFSDTMTPQGPGSFFVEVYGLHFVPCNGGERFSKADRTAMAALWPMAPGNHATLSNGTVFKVSEAFTERLPVGAVEGFIVTQTPPEEAGEPASTYFYLPEEARIAKWNYGMGTDYLLSIERNDAPDDEVEAAAFTACKLAD